MAHAARSAEIALAFESHLEQEPYRHGFYETLRWLECIHADAPRLGESVRAQDDAIRLGQEPSLAFAASSIHAYRRGGTEGKPKLQVNCFGLFGPNGPLPLHLTEHARDRLRNYHDDTLASFVDVFHHRMMSFFYRAWANSQPVVNHDRPESDRFATYLGSLLGIGFESLQKADAAPIDAKLSFAGHYAAPFPRPGGIEGILTGYLGMPVRVEEFTGAWMPLPEEYHCRLGEHAESCQLGVAATLGGAIWECHQRFTIHIGPISREEYELLLPGSSGLDRVDALVRHAVGFEYEWEIALSMKAEEVQPMALGGTERLGYTTWLTDGRAPRDVEGIHVRPLTDVA